MTRSLPSKVIAVFGFLGSGKTTVMMQLARAIVDRGHKAALVVNEAGDIPVDGKLLESCGLPVKEIFAGCICCSVVGDLISTLRTLARDPSLNVILIEPSGMANAPDLFAAIEKHAYHRVTKVAILDGPRLPLLLKAANTLITQQVKTAEIILLNKTEKLDREAAREIQQQMSELPINAKVHEVSALKGIPDELVDKILQ